MMACALQCCTCSNAFVYADVTSICYGCLLYHLLIWCLKIDNDGELALSNNSMPKCYVQVEHLDVSEETVNEATDGVVHGCFIFSPGPVRTTCFPRQA